MCARSLYKPHFVAFEKRSPFALFKMMYVVFVSAIFMTISYTFRFLTGAYAKSFSNFSGRQCQVEILPKGRMAVKPGIGSLEQVVGKHAPNPSNLLMHI